ncbi:SphA family protein [Bradyrhizobium vignae]|uniref:Protein involved in meta-pathway of phenol degradation n=1 Tax=Bradyrhizobium vignae TaxID=1549949 RepID=A0A2U3PV24_9BRAD|nr:transporter [Bradyrhizobium vignae]SPP92958.1 Protein involved in meta-pathway of phenol degradation [Bradyrhizobium vignae]
MAGIAALIATMSAISSANAFEFGSPGWEQKPGITIGGSAGLPPAGIYSFNQVFTYQANLTGPGNALLNPAGTKTGEQVAVGVNGILFVPGWTFLGATYSAVLAQPYVMASVGNPVNTQFSGIHNAYVVPGELSWRLGDSGFFVKAGLGMYVPTGTVTGANGLGNAGHPWWTFQPEFIVSYLKDGWNITANLYGEINTKNTITNYRSGDMLFAEFTAAKTIGNWTIGPVAYYAGQIGNDTSSAFYGGAINVNRYNIWAVGGLVGYNFGPAALNVWAFDEVSARASGGTLVPGFDTAAVFKGFSVFANLSFRLWAPETPSPTLPKFHK